VNIKVKFRPVVVRYYELATDLRNCKDYGGVQSNSYKTYCKELMTLAGFGNDGLAELAADLGDVSFQWQYYVTMPREDAFALQLKYSNLIVKIYSKE